MVNVDIPSQTSLVNDEINSLKSSKDKTERIEYYSAQNEVLLLYVKQIFFILYYIVFALMAVTLFTKRRQFSLLFVLWMNRKTRLNQFSNPSVLLLEYMRHYTS